MRRNIKPRSKQIFQSCDILSKYGRSPQIDEYTVNLRQRCDDIWSNGKQQCEFLRYARIDSFTINKNLCHDFVSVYVIIHVLCQNMNPAMTIQVEWSTYPRVIVEEPKDAVMIHTQFVKQTMIFIKFWRIAVYRVTNWRKLVFRYSSHPSMTLGLSKYC